MDQDIRSYLDDKFRGVHARLDGVEERGEKTQELANDLRSELREFRARAEERGAAAEGASLRADQACQARTAAVAERVSDLEGDRKKLLGGIAVAFITGLLSLFKFGFAKDT